MAADQPPNVVVPRPPPPPVIPELFAEIPSQRAYAVGAAVVFQAIKAYEVLRCYVLPSSGTSLRWLLFKWTLVDAAYIWCLPMLRIPWLTYGVGLRVRLVVLAIFVNWLLMGNYTIPSAALIPYFIRSRFDYELSISEHRVRVQDIAQSGTHLIGQHTVRLAPISVAELNPQAQSFCYDPFVGSVSIPVVFNNTQLTHLKYCVQSLDPLVEAPNCNELTGSHLKHLTAGKHFTTHGIEDDEFSVERPGQKAVAWESEPSSEVRKLQKTQELVFLQVKGPGIVRLSEVTDAEDKDVRIFGGFTTVVECPTAGFSIETAKQDSVIKCLGESHEVTMEMKGVPPFSIEYWREFDGSREELHVDGIEGPSPHDTSPLVSHSLSIPLPVTLSKAGTYSYGLRSVTDGLGNTVTLPSSSARRIPSKFDVTVLPRSTVRWRDCSLSSPRGIKTKGSVALPFDIVGADARDGPWTVKYAYKPVGDKSSPPSGSVREITNTKNTGQISAREAGDYELVGITGSHCRGGVKAPDTCRIVLWTEPTVKIDFEPIVDPDCKVEVGVKAHLSFHGKGPFAATYVVKKDGKEVERNKANFDRNRGEISLRTNGPGKYEYEVTSISDSLYKDVKIPRQSKTQVVHVVAGARLVLKDPYIQLWPCSGNTVDVQVELEGVPPWDLEFLVSSPLETAVVNKTGIMNNRETFTFAVPPDVDAAGGRFQVELVSVSDQAMCRKSVTSPSLQAGVSRIKATAGFVTAPEVATDKGLTVVQGQTTRLPLRLTGDRPITLYYRNLDLQNSDQTVTLQKGQDDIPVRYSGRYQLTSIKDAHGCRGTVDGTEFPVHYVPRPSISWNPAAGQPGLGDYITREAVCEGSRDHVEVDLSGVPSFGVVYEHEYLSNGRSSEKSFHEISSIQKTARLDLVTSPPGPHLYRLRSLKDDNYPSPAPVEFLPVLEQEVLRRPSASFKSDVRLPFCLHDALVPRTGFPNAVVSLEGQPPFDLILTFRNTTSSQFDEKAVTVDSHEWTVNFTDYTFDSIGPHLLRIVSVSDASGCPQAPADSRLQSLWVDVAETAAVLPAEVRSDYCVGETLQYQLEGTSPWTIKYEFNGKETTATSKTSKFSRVADKPGLFVMKSISHQNNLCVTTVDGINATIHDFPSAEVNHGKARVQSIREGDQAEIIFDLEGEPPFTFTYQRTELPSGKHGKPGKVLETHTLPGHKENRYSIQSSLEGTWTITSIADKYCRYPPVPPAQAETVVIEKI